MSLLRDQGQLNTLICVELYYYSMQIGKQTPSRRANKLERTNKLANQLFTNERLKVFRPRSLRNRISSKTQITKHAMCFYETQHLKMHKTVNEASGSLYLSCPEVSYLKLTYQQRNLAVNKVFKYEYLPRPMDKSVYGIATI